MRAFDHAIKDYTRALEIESDNAFAYYNRGISFDRKNEFENAIADFSSAIALNPLKADFFHNRGFAYKKLG